jgi:hypothetical protein
MSTPIDSDFPGTSGGACLGPVNNVDLRPRSPFTTAAALLPTTAVVILAALAFSTIDRSPVPAIASPTPSISRPAADSAGATQIVLRLSEGTATATLTDTAAAQQLAALLPVQLTLCDPMGQAKSGHLPTALAVADADRTTHPEVAGLYYWPPSGDLGIVYDDLGQTVPPPGMVQLGTVTSGLPTIASAGNRFTVFIERS